MPKVEKKYIKFAVVGLAAVALVVGLSVGLTRGKSNKNSAAASANAGGNSISAAGIDECYSGKSGKMGKSGGRGASDGNFTYSGKSGKAAKSASSGSGKAAKSASSGSGKSGKSDSRGNATHCKPVIRDICDTNFTYSGKGGKSSSGKSGKSGGGSGSGKSGKSGGRVVNGTVIFSGKGGKSGSYGYSGKGGKSGSYGRIVNGTCVCPSGSGKSGKSGSVGGSGKSGKSGSGKSGKSGSVNMNMTGTNFTSSGKSGKSGSVGGSGKSGKSDSYGPDGDRCSCGGPTVCGCTCATQPWYAFGDGTNRICARYGCNTPVPSPTLGRFNTVDQCCSGFIAGTPGFVAGRTCTESDADCGTAGIITPAPSPFAEIITQVPTAGSTPTVSTDTTGPPTKEGRSNDTSTSEDAADGELPWGG